MALVFLFIYTALIILHVEPEQDIIPILYHVFLAFHSHKPFFPRCCQGALLQKVLIIHHFSFNKAPFKIGMYLSGRLGSLRTNLDRPRPGLILA